MVSDSEDELPDIPYTSAFSTKWKVPAWARSRSRSGGRGSAAAAEVAAAADGILGPLMDLLDGTIIALIG